MSANAVCDAGHILRCAPVFDGNDAVQSAINAHLVVIIEMVAWFGPCAANFGNWSIVYSSAVDASCLCPAYDLLLKTDLPRMKPR